MVDRFKLALESHEPASIPWSLLPILLTNQPEDRSDRDSKPQDACHRLRKTKMHISLAAAGNPKPHGFMGIAARRFGSAGRVVLAGRRFTRLCPFPGYLRALAIRDSLPAWPWRRRSMFPPAPLEDVSRGSWPLSRTP
jgi:hypothetical protein